MLPSGLGELLSIVVGGLATIVSYLAKRAFERVENEIAKLAIQCTGLETKVARIEGRMSGFHFRIEDASEKPLA